eukprot:gb/GECH01013879.1/.p1 GENE.gb/GECH01013879.1/~~gb/GECH01013879.1/.p1  ORF type:complete len:453 (+),score=17.74 gb/GECH01013879.1/:1-1359(+)
MVDEVQLYKLFDKLQCPCNTGYYVEKFCQQEHVTVFYFTCEYNVHSVRWPTSCKIKDDSFFVNRRIVGTFIVHNIGYATYKRICSTMNINHTSKSSWYTLIRTRFHPIVNYIFKQHTKKKRTSIDKIVLGLDGRYESRRNGHWCTVTLFNHFTKEIIGQQSLNNTLTDNNSKRLEKEAVRLVLKNISSETTIQEVIHDEDSSVSKVLRTEYSDVKESKDAWHKIKNLTKRFKTFAEDEGLPEKVDSYFKNHLYYCFSKANDDNKKLHKLFVNFSNHYSGDHSSCLEPRGKACSEAPDLFSPSQREKIANKCKELLSEEECKFYASNRFNSYCECFYRHLLRFTPKFVFQPSSYSMHAMLAALDWNSNHQIEDENEETWDFAEEAVKLFEDGSDSLEVVSMPQLLPPPIVPNICNCTMSCSSKRCGCVKRKQLCSDQCGCGDGCQNSSKVNNS